MKGKLEHFTDRPDLEGMPSALPTRPDALSHLLAWVWLRGETVYRAELHDPWRLRFPQDLPMCISSPQARSICGCTTERLSVLNLVI